MGYRSSHASPSPSPSSRLLSSSGSSASEAGNEEESPLLQHQAQSSNISLGPPGRSISTSTGFGYVDYEEAEGMTMVPTMATRFRQFLKLLETDHESGLTNAQLLLINDDLKPGMVSIRPPVRPPLLFTLPPFFFFLFPFFSLRIYNSKVI